MKEIYILSSVQKDTKSIRCFGYYGELENAKKAVEQNLGGMHEQLYDFLVIEKFKPGVHTVGEIVQWYKWNHSWEPIERPRWAEGIVNWGIG